MRFPLKGRGAIANPAGRYEALAYGPDDDAEPEEAAPPLRTTVTDEACRTIISRNRSPDIPFDRSINPYRGCEHGCVYCYARPTHAYLGLSPGLDFETKLFAKADAAAVLGRELAKPGYKPRPIMLGANTDPYQPIERSRKITRAILEVLSAHRHPVTITTKAALVVRDLDLLAEMGEARLASVGMSLTTLDPGLARVMEPRASSPARRLAAIAALAEAGVPVTVMAAPMIPFVNDHELERILGAAAVRRGGKRRLHSPSPPVGTEGGVRRLAGGPSPRPGGTGAGPAARLPRRQSLRLRLRRADARQGRLCRDPRQALRPRLQASRPCYRAAA